MPRSEAFALDPDLLAAERSRIKLLLVDDAQHLDPQATQLVRVLAAGTELTVIAGTPTRRFSVTAAASPSLLRGDEPADHPDPVAALFASVARRHHRVARRLPGADAARQVEGADDRPGSLTVRLAATPHAEAALIADALRRAHLVDGVPWSQMAVIVRSVPRLGAALARALVAAGVPVESTAPNAPLADQPAARALLTVLDATAHGLDGDRALSLLTGPIGRVDPVSLRQLRRALRRADGRQPPREFTELLVEALDNETEALSADHGRPLRRVRAVLAAARGSAADGQDPRYTLWQAWHRSGLQRRWLAASERGGPAGAQADRDLEAVTALFDVTEQYVSRTAGASLRGLVDHVEALGPTRDTPRSTTGDRRGGNPQRARGARAGNGSSSSSPAYRKGCGPTRFPAAACWAPNSSSMCSTASPRRPTGDCSSERRCWPRNAGC